jgi:hypothetical protein
MQAVASTSTAESNGQQLVTRVYNSSMLQYNVLEYCYTVSRTHHISIECTSKYFEDTSTVVQTTRH